jgi:hypothetical protein
MYASACKGTEGLAIAAYVRQMKADLGGQPHRLRPPQNAAAAARLGVDAFLHKPVSLVWLKELASLLRIATRRGVMKEEEAAQARSGGGQLACSLAGSYRPMSGQGFDRNALQVLFPQRHGLLRLMARDLLLR